MIDAFSGFVFAVGINIVLFVIVRSITLLTVKESK